MRRLFWALALLLLAACGLADDERDERNKRIYLTFSDPAFEACCLEKFDTDHDGRLSRYEAQRVRTIVCPDRSIERMDLIGEFIRLERLDCRGNRLQRLDLRNCTFLREVDCSANRLVALDVDGLRGLVTLDCSRNRLPGLDLRSNNSLSQLDCTHNALSGVLDLTACAATLRADTRSNPSLATVYCLPSQSVELDGGTVREER